MTRILVPVDGSACAVRATQAAIAWASRDPSIEIHLLNVQTPVPLGLLGRGLSKEGLEAHYRAEGDAALAPSLELLDEAGLERRARVEVGPVAETICATADEIGADEIVMGTRGLDTVSAFVVGSSTASVVTRSPVPVTLIK